MWPDGYSNKGQEQLQNEIEQLVNFNHFKINGVLLMSSTCYQFFYHNLFQPRVSYNRERTSRNCQATREIERVITERKAGKGTC